jgi:ketosteroid isomerase-like protein
VTLERDRNAVLFANEAFYIAFRARDMTAMQALWAQRAPIACSHPGWTTLNGRQDVLESWRGILANPQSPAVEMRQARVLLLGDAAIVTCYELIGDIVLAASNVFVREDAEWRLVHHHSSQAAALPDSEPESSGTTSVQ